jgi:lantibiotic modifying enzyme
LTIGFAHGASGIAHALGELARASGDATFSAAMSDAFAFERDADEHEGPQPFASTWCHGAPGIGLARAAALAIGDEPAVRADLDAAVAAARDTELSLSDHLCCGNLGRAEFLWTAGDCLDRCDLREAALAVARQVIERAHRRGTYAVGPDEAFRPRSIRACRDRHQPSFST